MCVVLRVLVQGICSYLGGSATAEETEVAKKNLDHIDQELGASGLGLLDDQEVHRLEDDLAVVYYQLGTAVRKLTHAVRRANFLSGLTSARQAMSPILYLFFNSAHATIEFALNINSYSLF